MRFPRRHPLALLPLPLQSLRGPPLSITAPHQPLRAGLSCQFGLQADQDSTVDPLVDLAKYAVSKVEV